jgi:hypothetical protein
VSADGGRLAYFAIDCSELPVLVVRNLGTGEETREAGVPPDEGTPAGDADFGWWADGETLVTVRYRDDNGALRLSLTTVHVAGDSLVADPEIDVPTKGVTPIGVVGSYVIAIDRDTALIAINPMTGQVSSALATVTPDGKFATTADGQALLGDDAARLADLAPRPWMQNAATVLEWHAVP